MALNIWLDTVEVADPPERLPRSSNGRTRQVGLLFRLHKLLLSPGIWHKVAAGADNKLSPYTTAINSGQGLPGRWEATTRQGILYVRYLGDD